MQPVKNFMLSALSCMNSWWSNTVAASLSGHGFDWTFLPVSVWVLLLPPTIQNHQSRMKWGTLAGCVWECEDYA